VAQLIGRWNVLAAATVLVLLATGCGSRADVGAATSASSTGARTTAAATITPQSATTAPVAARGGPPYLSCGVVVANSITTGEGSAVNSYQLSSATGVLGSRFVWQAGQAPLGSYVCVRLTGGAPLSGFAGVVSPTEADYVPQAADGAEMLITLVAGGVSTQYFLEYQFAGDSPPKDIGDRLAAQIPQTLLITGRPVPPAAGAPGAINLHDYNVARVAGCTPLSGVTPQPAGFVLPLGCAYIGQPVVGGDQSVWKFDCGWASNNARGSLAPALIAQGWTCGSPATATATWAKGSARLVVVEGAGGAGGYPQLAQLRLGIQTGC